MDCKDCELTSSSTDPSRGHFSGNLGHLSLHLLWELTPEQKV
uniref:Uncharacterized protein n=1 Tax=Anguilla anguilla TaxID=7936 RepID=A0A0E9PYY9_ANGAN